MKLDQIKRLFAEVVVGKQVKIGGWIRTKRDAKGFSFLEINDGSCLANIQVIADQSLVNYNDEIKKLTTGCSVVVTGELKESPAKGQPVEIQAEKVVVAGWADPESAIWVGRPRDHWQLGRARVQTARSHRSREWPQD